MHENVCGHHERALVARNQQFGCEFFGLQRVQRATRRKRMQDISYLAFCTYSCTYGTIAVVPGQQTIEALSLFVSSSFGVAWANLLHHTTAFAMHISVFQVVTTELWTAAF